MSAMILAAMHGRVVTASAKALSNNGNGALNVMDIFDFLNAWFDGC